MAALPPGWTKRRCSAALAGSLQRLGLLRYVSDTSDAILAYHAVGDPQRYGNITVDRFRRELQYLTDRYRVVDLPALLDPSDDKRVVLTFDDAYESFYHNALPVLEAFDVPATLFVPVGFVGNDRPELAYRFVRSPAETDHFNDPETQSDPSQPAGVMSWDQLRTVAENRLITVGNHTLTHPDLATVTDRETLEREILAPRDRLRAKLGVSVDRFCYPYGRYCATARGVVQETHSFAVTSRQGLVSGPRQVDQYTLPRVKGHLPPHLVRWQVARG